MPQPPSGRGGQRAGWGWRHEREGRAAGSRTGSWQREPLGRELDPSTSFCQQSPVFRDCTAPDGFYKTATCGLAPPLVAHAVAAFAVGRNRSTQGSIRKVIRATQPSLPSRLKLPST